MLTSTDRFCKNNLPKPGEVARGKHVGVEDLNTSIQARHAILNTLCDSSDSQKNGGNSL